MISKYTKFFFKKFWESLLEDIFPTQDPIIDPCSNGISCVPLLCVDEKGMHGKSYDAFMHKITEQDIQESQKFWDAIGMSDRRQHDINIVKGTRKQLDFIPI